MTKIDYKVVLRKQIGWEALVKLTLTTTTFVPTTILAMAISVPYHWQTGWLMLACYCVCGYVIWRTRNKKMQEFRLL